MIHSLFKEGKKYEKNVAAKLAFFNKTGIRKLLQIIFNFQRGVTFSYQL